MVTDAVSMARRLDDPATLAYVLINGQLATWGPDTTERDLEWVEELLVLTEEAGNAELALQTRTRQIDYLLELDDLVGADIALLALERTAEESPDPRARAYLPLQRARRAALEGRYAEAEAWNAEAASVGNAIEDRMVQLLAVAQLTMLRWTQGRIGEVEQLVRRFADAAPGIVGWRAALSRIYCALGREAEARRELERLHQMGFANLPRYNGWLNMMALLSETCAHLEDARCSAAVYDLLLPFERRNVVTAQCVFDGPVSRFLGILATTMGDWDSASRHFEVARSASARTHARPFVALTAIDQAAMLVARDQPGDAAQALTLLEEGRGIADELDMDLVVERVERMRTEIGEVPAAGAAETAVPAEVQPVTSSTARMQWEGDVWALDFDGHAIHIRDSKGVRYLATLLESPGVEIHCLELAGSAPDADARGRDRGTDLPASTGGDAGPALDDEAKAAYRRRLVELREDLEEAESFNDPERAARARDGDGLLGEGGGRCRRPWRPRPQGGFQCRACPGRRHQGGSRNAEADRRDGLRSRPGARRNDQDRNFLRLRTRPAPAGLVGGAARMTCLEPMEELAKESLAEIDDDFGYYPGYRAAQAKGVLLSGWFTAGDEAGALTRAVHFQPGSRTPVTARFSNFTANPDRHDGTFDVRGMATSFHLPDGLRADITALRMPRFFIGDAQTFLRWQRSSTRTSWDLPRPRFLLAIPYALKGVTPRVGYRQARPLCRVDSFAGCRYNALHAFRWVNADSKAQYVRYSWVPEIPEAAMKLWQRRLWRAPHRSDPDFLRTELVERVAQWPVCFRLEVQLAGEGDPVDDASKVWPQERPTITVGMLQLTEMGSWEGDRNGSLRFDPVRTVDGIELPEGDSILMLRKHVYEMSAERRSKGRRVSAPAQLPA